MLNKDMVTRCGWEHHLFGGPPSPKRAHFNEVYKLIAGDQALTHKLGVNWVRFVVERWLFIEEFVDFFGIEKFWHFDSDTMIIQSLGQYEESFGDIDFTVQCEGNCLNGFITAPAMREVTSEFCRAFEDEELLELMRKRFSREIERSHALTEMELFCLYRKKTERKNVDLRFSVPDRVFDDFLVREHGFEMMEIYPGKYIKKLYNHENKIYGNYQGNLIEFVILNLSWVPDELFKWVLLTVTGAGLSEF